VKILLHTVEKMAQLYVLLLKLSQKPPKIRPNWSSCKCGKSFLFQTFQKYFHGMKLIEEHEARPKLARSDIETFLTPCANEPA
jgi:hypothetical protein